MDAAAIFALITKGLQYIPLAVEAGVSIENTIATLLKLSQGGEAGTLTDAERQQAQNDLDADIADFNAPIED